ncbi:MAG TPA: hypothetical protein VMV57_09320 [Terracidiphilus sp.]|nr:hypothetical protein [Terracidiphilus sp.]
MGLASAAILLLAGCGGAAVAGNPAGSAFSISPGTAQIDTNCTGCNATGLHGSHVNRFTASLAAGGAANVLWSVAGGDPVAGPGTIDARGEYSPPSYLTVDRARVVVTAALRSNPQVHAEAVLTVAPGFLQPLTPENVALGPGGSVTVTGLLAEAGGSASIHFALAQDAAGTEAAQGTLSATTCQRSAKAFTMCAVTYTAPATLASTRVIPIQATADGPAGRIETQVLLNTAGVASSPASHQSEQITPMLLGSSGGNNNDFDANGNTIVDCCSGTLGALVRNMDGTEFLLSNNHVLARSDQASVGDAIVQPGLIDNNCTPSGDGPGAERVGSLTAWLPLRSPETNADAAIAQVESNTVNGAGSILELGNREPDGRLAAAPPGVTSTAGHGEAAVLSMRVAKSGRTTGLTCGGVSVVSLDISVDYYRDCAETKPYLTKTFTNQIGVSGDHWSDAGDSGALLVDTENAEPVGLYFAGGMDASGVEEGVANPARDVLSELNAQLGRGSSLTFVGGPDHPVSCLSFGNSTVEDAQARALSDAQIARVQAALMQARALVNPPAGVLGVAMGKSSDEPGGAAVIVYVNQSNPPRVPVTIDGVRTVVVPTTAPAVALGSAPMTDALSGGTGLSAATLNRAIAIQQQFAASWMRAQPAFFGIGVGQSLDHPQEAALVIYVDREQVPAHLPATLDGLRTRYVVMDRMHVTRSYAVPFQPRLHCTAHTLRTGAVQSMRRPFPGVQQGH